MPNSDIHIIVASHPADETLYWGGEFGWTIEKIEAQRFDNRAAADRKYRDLLIRNARLDPTDRMDIEVVSW